MATIDTQYIYSLGRVKELEKSLLTTSNIDRMLESDDPFAVLRSIGFFKSSEEHEDGTEVAEIFRYERVHNRAVLHELIADSPLEDIFLLPYDIHNLKLLLKGKLTGNSAGKEWALEEGKYPKQTLIEAVYDDVSSELPGAIVDDIRNLTEALQNSTQFSSVDYCFDRRLRALQLEIAHNAKNMFVIDYLRRLSDVQNISTIIRRKTHELGRDNLKDTLLEGGTLDLGFLEKVYDSGWESMATAFKPTDHSKWVADALAQIERSNFPAILDTCGAQYLIEFLHTARQHTFGIGQILAFHIIRDLELKVVRTLWIGKAFGYPQEKLTLRNRLN